MRERAERYRQAYPRLNSRSFMGGNGPVQRRVRRTDEEVAQEIENSNHRWEQHHVQIPLDANNNNLYKHLIALAGSITNPAWFNHLQDLVLQAKGDEELDEPSLRYMELLTEKLDLVIDRLNYIIQPLTNHHQNRDIPIYSDEFNALYPNHQIQTRQFTSREDEIDLEMEDFEYSYERMNGLQYQTAHMNIGVELDLNAIAAPPFDLVEECLLFGLEPHINRDTILNMVNTHSDQLEFINDNLLQRPSHTLK